MPRGDTETMKKKLPCDTCKAKNCENCNLLYSNSIIDEKELYEKLWNNVKVVELNGKQRIKCKYEYKRDIRKVFAPENSNVREAIGRTKSLINKLKRQGGTALMDFKAEIKKKIELGTLERMSPQRAKEELAGPHHCTYPGVVTSETSTSTETRKINDTNTNVP